MTERVLTQRELNRATLARQLLLERAPLTAKAAVEHLVGLQAQWPPAPYVGLWSRLQAFERAALERLLASGEVVKATVMRQTLHLVTRRDYGLIRAAMSETNFPWETSLAKRIAPGVRALALASHLTNADGVAHVEAEHGLTGIDARRAWRFARSAAHLVNHHETALWDARPEGRYVPLDEPDAHDATEARAELLRRYLAAFGPSTQRDLSAWSMMHAPELKRSLARLELRRFRNESGKELLDVPDAPLPDPETPAPVRFLPKWDNLMLAWADRTRVISDERRAVVIAKNGDVAQTVLVDGVVAGTWRADKGRVAVEPFGKLTRETKAEVAEEAARLETFLTP